MNLRDRRHEQVKRIFLEACAVSAEARGAFLDRVCGGDAAMREEVQRLLVADESFTGDAPLPERLGSYRIVRRIGVGGMGIVYEGEQEDPRRRVAIKVLRASIASRQSLQRFQLEAEMLGRLQHPGIAQIFAARTLSSGEGEQPYLVTELIEGDVLNQYADRHHLPVRARVDLLIRICDAVHHAHQKGIIHRDLKPANILVTGAGQPKILDFGIARATGPDPRGSTLSTVAGQILGTLAYMSPEQAAGDPELDVRSDVYSLGVIAFELLSGRLPLDLSGQPLPQALRRVQEGELPRLRKFQPHVDRDLEAIVARALATEKNRRYASASELGADLRRFLDHEPIAARPATALYQAYKFARRNRLLVGSALLLFLVLVGAVVVSGSLYFEAVAAGQAAEEAGGKARAEAETANQVVAFLMEMFGEADPGVHRGDVPTALELLDRGAARIATDLEEQPLVRARLMDLIGHVYQILGSYHEARPLLEEALVLRRRLHEGPHEETALTLERLAHVLHRQDEDARALELQKEATSMYAVLLGEDSVDYLAALNNEAAILRGSGEPDAAAARLLAVTERTGNEEQLATALGNLGIVRSEQGRYEEADHALRRAFEIVERLHGWEDPRTIGVGSSWGTVLRDLQRYAESEALQRRCLAQAEKLYGTDSPALERFLEDLGLTLLEAGHPGESESLFRRGLELCREEYGDEHPEVALQILNLASALHDLSRGEEAEHYYLEALDLFLLLGREDWPPALTALNNLALLYHQAGRFPQAEELFLDALERRRRVLGPEHPHTLGTLYNLAALYRDLGAAEKEEAARRELVERSTAARGEDHPDTVEYTRGLREMVERRGGH